MWCRSKCYSWERWLRLNRMSEWRWRIILHIFWSEYYQYNNLSHDIVLSLDNLMRVCCATRLDLSRRSSASFYCNSIVEASILTAALTHNFEVIDKEHLWHSGNEHHGAYWTIRTNDLGTWWRCLRPRLDKNPSITPRQFCQRSNQSDGELCIWKNKYCSHNNQTCDVNFLYTYTDALLLL